MTQTITWDM